MKLSAWYPFLMCAISSGMLWSTELRIPEEPCFSEPVPFPATSLPHGRFSRAVAPEWKVISLNGEWKFKEVGLIEGRNLLTDEGMKRGIWKPEIPTDDWQTVQVPSETSWYCHGPLGKAGNYRYKKVDYVKGKIGYYRRDFTLSEGSMQGNRIILDFCRVGERADVWVNGQSAGSPHIGRSGGFQYDITSLVRTGNNSLSVRVYDWLGYTRYPLRKQGGGLVGPVRIVHVPAAFYVPRSMVTPNLKNNTIAVRLETISSREIKGITAEIFNWKDGKIVATKVFEEFSVPQGQVWRDLGTVKLPSPRLWCPEDPHLYGLRLRDKDGRIAGYERFGFREFKAEGEWLLLNGKRFKPRMVHMGTLFSVPLHNNQQGDTEKLLRLFKERLNVNMIRSNSGSGAMIEAAYSICDEIGLLVYFDWSGVLYYGYANYPDMERAFKLALPDLESFVLDNYNRPSIVMWSLGNELYEGASTYTKGIDHAYGFLKQLDRQGRPISGSSGRYNIELIQSGLLTERTDVLDDHQYRGSYCGSWQENIDHIERYAEAALKHFGRKMPKINAEYGAPGDAARYYGKFPERNILPVLKMDRTTKEFKEGYARLLRNEMLELGGVLRLKSNFATPDDYMAKKPVYEKFGGKYTKRFMEIYRRAGTNCLGGHTNLSWYDFVRDFPDGYRQGNEPLMGSQEWRVMPAFYTLARCYNPTFVSAGVFNEQPYAGSTQKLELFVTNDLNEKGTFEVVSQLRLESGLLKRYPKVTFGTLDGMEQKSVIFGYEVPNTGKIEHGKLEFYLFKNGKRVGDNYYPVSIFPRRNVTLPVKCALYDTAGVKYRGLLKTPCTLENLKHFGGKFDLIGDFSKLDQYTHLILGTNSFDSKVIDGGEDILKWVKKGGKLLVLEQNLCGKVPFLSNYSIISGNPGTHVIMVDPQHPIFRNLRQEDMDSWFGNMGRMSRFGISPLDVGMVAVTPMTSYADTQCINSVLSDVNVGKGEIIFSQLSSGEKIEQSGAAGEYFVSLLEYFSTSGVSKYALSLSNVESGTVQFLSKKRAFHIDLSKVANRSFKDDTAADGLGGWTDFGSADDFRSIPVGQITSLHGGVPFKILDPKSNGGKSCIVLKGKKRPIFPAEVTGIPVDALLNRLFVLHTSMYVDKPGVTVSYVITYEDGQRHEFVADNRYDLPDWWMAQNKRNAQVVFRDGGKCLFVSEFINPRPNVKITSLDIRSRGEAIPVVIAITGDKRFTSGVAGVGEK